jgi:DNA polymerase-3 subunit chi
MTRIDFYVLSSNDLMERLQLICKLSEKAIGQAQKVFIHSDSDEELKQLDHTLWDFRPISFVPHKLLPQGYVTSGLDNEAVHLSCNEPGADRTLLINLANEVPSFFSRFERTLEVINDEPDIKASGRLRYRYYQQRGYPLKHHKI